MAEILGNCPVCGSQTEITRISCESCDTTIQGHFKSCKFCRLSCEQRNFIEVFIKCRGNIKEVEKELGISYPTVKNRLEDAAGALGYSLINNTSEDSKRKTILEKLNNGDIGVEEALNMLRD